MLCTVALIIVAITRYRLSRRSMLVGCILGASACKWKDEGLLFKLNSYR